MTSPRLFISYSHHDEELLKEFTAHLAPLINNGTITSWDDRELVLGDQLDETLRSELQSADLIAFLVSSDFLSSISCYEHELLRVLELRSSGRIGVLPIILRECLWKDTPLKNFVAAPKDGKPVTSFSDKDAAWVYVAEQIKLRAAQWVHDVSNLRDKPTIYEASAISLNPNFMNWLIGTEVSFQHKVKEKVHLPDVFIYPDLRGRQDRDNDFIETVNSSQLKHPDFVGDGILLHGEEQAGKTSLIKMLYSHYHDQDFLPLYVDAGEITSSDLKRAFSRPVRQQYEGTTWDDYISTTAQRILFVDNYHALKLNIKFEARFLEAIRAAFQHKVLVADSSLTFDEKRMVEVSPFRRWEMLPLGHARRGELIERWNSLGEEETIGATALQRRNDDTTRKLNAIIRRNLLPPKPFFVLTVIQLLDSLMPTNFELSSYGHCYQALILQALHKVGVRTQNFDLYVNYLSELAYSCFSHGGESLTSDEFKNFTEKYSQRFLLGSHEEILKTLTRAEIVRIDVDDRLRFSYQYIFYFYAAKYLADHIEDCEHEIENLCERLHSERNANIVIFLMHHSRDQRIIDEVLLRAEMIFDQVPVATLHRRETEHILGVAQQIPELVIDQIDVESERRKELERRDHLDAAPDDSEKFEEQLKDADTTVIDIVRSARMIDVVGQILRNRSGSLEKKQLSDLAQSGFETGLRFLRFWLEFTRREKGDIVALIAGALLAGADGAKDDEKTRKAAMELYLNLCYDVCHGVLGRIANSLGARELIEIFETLEQQEPDSVAIMLLNIAIQMEFTKRIPKSKINKLSSKLRSNPIAGLLLRQLVIQHLYLNEVRVGDKQWISSKLGISIRSQRRLEGSRATKI